MQKKVHALANAYFRALAEASYKETDKKSCSQGIDLDKAVSNVIQVACKNQLVKFDYI